MILKNRKTVDLFDDMLYNIMKISYDIEILEKYLDNIIVEEEESRDPNREDVVINNLFYNNIIVRITKYNVIRNELLERSMVALEKNTFLSRREAKKIDRMMSDFERNNSERLIKIIEFIKQQQE